MSAREIHPYELLRLAERLVPADVGRGKPRTVELRRGVSTAYYALFHELIWQATRELVGDEPTAKIQRYKASRWIAHAEVKELAKAASGASPTSALASVLGPVDQRLARVAEAFVTLHEERERADYDHEYDIKRRDALLLIATAREAVDTVRLLRKESEVSFTRFVKLMVAVKTAKKR